MLKRQDRAQVEKRIDREVLQAFEKALAAPWPEVTWA